MIDFALGGNRHQHKYIIAAFHSGAENDESELESMIVDLEHRIA